MKTEMGTVTCTKVLRWVRLIPTALFYEGRGSLRNGFGDGSYPDYGFGKRYGTDEGDGNGYGHMPSRWKPNGMGGGHHYGGLGC